MRAQNIGLLVMALASLSSGLGCGKERESTPTTTTSASVATPTPPVPSTPAPAPVEAPKPAPHVELQIASVANTMTFDKTALTVPAGAEVHLTFTNKSNMSTLPHNWALVKPNTEASVAAAGLKYGDKAGYIDINDHDMLVHTPLTKAGESSEVTFTAPEPGKYPYICTVPGHYMLMKGVLTVTP